MTLPKLHCPHMPPWVGGGGGGGGEGGSLVLFKVEHMHSYSVCASQTCIGLSSFSFPTLGNMLSVYIFICVEPLSLLTLLWDVPYTCLALWLCMWESLIHNLSLFTHAMIQQSARSLCIAVYFRLQCFIKYTHNASYNYTHAYIHVYHR